MKARSGFSKAIITALVLILTFFALLCSNHTASALAMPFYDLQPKDLVLRSEFTTTYKNSTKERIDNVKLASKSLNCTLIDVGGEFSFNRTVGERTEKRGYKQAKIIVNGEFVNGVGGGVCQVSSTLYNAALLAGLEITECHPHSLPVGYVPPSFDAMVNATWSDLRFINNTHNPLIIVSTATNTCLTIKIYGEPDDFTYERKSVVIKEIPAPKEEIVFDQNNEFPDLFVGEQRVLRYSKSGLKSEGYVIKRKNGKIVSNIRIRKDSYSPTKGLIVIGTAQKEQEKTEQLSPEIDILELIYTKLREKFLNHKKIL